MSIDKTMAAAVSAGLDPKLIAKLAAAAGAIATAAPAVKTAVHAVADVIDDKPAKPKVTKAKPTRGR